jgi:hypothetical protein
MQRISTQLKHQLSTKMDNANRWGAQNQSKHSTGVNSHRGHSNPDAAFYSMMQSRAKLPAYKMKDHIVDTISSHQITVVSGDTGCGKTTQVRERDLGVAAVAPANSSTRGTLRRCPSSCSTTSSSRTGARRPTSS